MGLEPATRQCRSCSDGRLVPFLDLGPQPLAGWFPLASDAPTDPTWPLRPAVCESCWLVQLADEGPDEFDLPGAPAPTSSTSMQAHARSLVAGLIQGESVQSGSRVMEAASHGGYLQPFFAERGVVTTVLEDQPARADRVRASGRAVIDGSLEELDGGSTRLGAHSVDLFVDHYLLSHLRRPEAALAGIAWLLTATGVAVLEFDHVLPTIRGLQFDAFRHGHRSYLSLTWLVSAAARHGLTITDVSEQPVYGGALRVHMQRTTAKIGASRAAVDGVLSVERVAGLGGLQTYRAFADAVVAARSTTVATLREQARDGRPMVGYGAPARAVTLLNYYGLDPGVVPVTADASAAKQGRYIPGVRIPIVSPEVLRTRHPADVLILAWDLAPEIINSLEAAGTRGARYWAPIPQLHRAQAGPHEP